MVSKKRDRRGKYENNKKKMSLDVISRLRREEENEERISTNNKNNKEEQVHRMYSNHVFVLTLPDNTRSIEPRHHHLAATCLNSSNFFCIAQTMVARHFGCLDFQRQIDWRVGYRVNKTKIAEIRKQI